MFISDAVSRVGEWSIQRLVAATGRRLRAGDEPWLDGPLGGAGAVGAGVYGRIAAERGLAVDVNPPGAGLLEHFDELAGPECDPAVVHPEIRRFYERTGEYTMDAWVEWRGVMGAGARLLVALVSPRMEQLNLPLTPLAASRGITSDIVRLADPATGRMAYAGWLRHVRASRRVLYAGFYTPCTPPRAPGPCIKAVFPVPRGATTVILRPRSHPDGSFSLTTHGSGWGDAGFYRLHGTAPALRVRRFGVREVLHNYVDADGVMRTDHTIRYMGQEFMRMHYKVTRRGR
ncbi:MAG TPA: hypothetical protein VF705_14890 [Longimicrobium sp.]|jgi:hypothetical protein